MQGTGSIAEASLPDVLREVEGEKAEEEAGYFEPQDSAEATEGTQKAAKSATGCTSDFVGFRNISGWGNESGSPLSRACRHRAACESPANGIR